MKLPTEGSTRAEVMALLERSMAGDLAWHEGRTFSLVYPAGDEHPRLLPEAYALFMATNGLGTGRIFQSLAALEDDLMAGAPPSSAARVPGQFTSGGSESIILGLRAAQRHGRAAAPDAGPSWCCR